MHFYIQWRIPKPSEWRAACSFIRKRFRNTDGLTVGPTWADPHLRYHLGDLMTLADAGRSDNSRYQRLWALSIYDQAPPDAPTRPADQTKTFGRVRVLQWDLKTPTLIDDLVERFAAADISSITTTRMVSQNAQPCPWQAHAEMSQGGLETGPMWPERRFECDSSRPWLWVGATVIEDLTLKPRRCVWQHPQGTEPIVTTIDGVRLGESLVFYGGLYYLHEREKIHGPVFARIIVRHKPYSFERVFEHRDGDGWKRMLVHTPGLSKKVGQVSIHTWAPDPDLRTFCWAASTRTTPSGF